MPKLEKKRFKAESVTLSKCPLCSGLHLNLTVNDVTEVVAIMSPEKWAEIFLSDVDFCRKVAATLGKN